MSKRHHSNPAAQANDLWQIVLKFKWVVLLVGMVLSAFLIVMISLLPDHYEATTTVLVDTQKIPEKYVSTTVASDPLRLNLLTQEVLSSSRLEQIVDQFHFYSADARKTVPLEAVIEGMRKNIKIEAAPSGDRSMNHFTITYKSGNPKLVAPIANQLAASFIEWSLAQRDHQTAGTTEFLATELQEAKKENDEQEEKLRSFKMQHLGELPEQQQANSQALSRLQVALQANADALNRLDQEKTMMQQAPESSRTGPKTAVDSERMLLDGEQQKLKETLADLRTRYSDEHPDVQQAKERLLAVQKLLHELSPAVSPAADSHKDEPLEIAARETKRLQESQKQLLAQINTYQARIDAAPLREQEIAELNRKDEESKAHYQSLLEKTYSANLAKDMESKQAGQFFTIIDSARDPEAPSSPHRLPLFFMAVPFSYLLAAGLVIVFEHLRGAVRNERELRQLLPDSAIIIGSIPVIETPKFMRRQRQIAALSVSGTLICVFGIAIFLWRCHPHL